MHSLITVLTHKQILDIEVLLSIIKLNLSSHLALVALTWRLVTHYAGLTLVTSPALSLKVGHQLFAVHLVMIFIINSSLSSVSIITHPAAGMDTLTAAMAADQPLSLTRGVTGLSAQTLGADRDNWRLLRGIEVRHCRL